MEASLRTGAELLDPLRHDLRVAKRPQALKRVPRRFPHGLPIASRIEVHHGIGDQNASAQRSAQIVDRFRGQSSANVGFVPLGTRVRPIGQSDAFLGVGARLRQDKNQYPSERSPGRVILAARSGEKRKFRGGQNSVGQFHTNSASEEPDYSKPAMPVQAVVGIFRPRKALFPIAMQSPSSLHTEVCSLRDGMAAGTRRRALLSWS